MKKGKAARGIIGGFIAKSPVTEEDEELRNRERELLKSLRGITPPANAVVSPPCLFHAFVFFVFWV
jgi:hypothetical protein